MPAGFSGRRRILERTPRAEPRLSRFPSAREAPDCSRSGRLVSCALDSRCGGRTCLRERDRSVVGVVPSDLRELPSFLGFSRLRGSSAKKEGKSRTTKWTCKHRS